MSYGLGQDPITNSNLTIVCVYLHMAFKYTTLNHLINRHPYDGRRAVLP